VVHVGKMKRHNAKPSAARITRNIRHGKRNASQRHKARARRELRRLEKLSEKRARAFLQTMSQVQTDGAGGKESRPKLGLGDMSPSAARMVMLRLLGL
jgi:uncharacterized protein YjiS (DUF1127 family)